MKVYKDKVLQASSVLFILNMLASGLNYICQLFMARTLSVESFGTINTIFSFLLIVGVPGTTLTMIVAKYYAETDVNDNKNRSGYMSSIVKGVLYLSVLTFVFCIILRKVLSQGLAIDDIYVLLFTIVLSALSFFQPLYSGVFSGNKCFILVGIYSLLIPLYKIASIVIAQIACEEDLGRLYIVLIVMILGTIFTAIYGHVKTKRIVGKFSIIEKNSIKVGFKSDDVNTLILNICLMIYMNIDLLAVRYYGNTDESGLYSSVLLFGRIVYYFATTLGTILLPMVATEKDNQKEQIKLLNKTLVLMLGFVCVCVIPINLFGEFIIGILYGDAYIGAVVYIKYVSFISSVLSICTLLINYLVGIGKTKVATISMILVVVLIAVLILMVKEVETILAGIGIIGLFGAVYIYFMSIYRGVFDYRRKANDR